MGWTGYYNPPSDPKAELIRILETTTDDAPMTYKVVHTSQRGNVFYFAVKITPRDPKTFDCSPFIPDIGGSYTIGAVGRTRRNRGEWLYRLDDETVGPIHAEAPIALINKLSELPMFPEDGTGAEWATKWRARCVNNTKQRSSGKLSHGDVIEFHNKPTFDREDVGKSGKFRVLREPNWNGRKRTVFVCLDTNTRCRITSPLRLAHTLHKGGAGHG